MKRFAKLKWLGLLPIAALALHTESARACAACFGKSDSPLAEGMNWGIFSLLGVVVCVLGGFAAAGIYFVRRANARPLPVPPPEPQGELLPATQKA